MLNDLPQKWMIDGFKSSKFLRVACSDLEVFLQNNSVVISTARRLGWFPLNTNDSGPLPWIYTAILSKITSRLQLGRILILDGFESMPNWSQLATSH